MVIAGALIEHISDPVTAIGNMARLAREAVIIAFTPVEESDKQFMQTTNKWDNSSFNYTWWTLSKGLYRRVFDNLGFDAEFKQSFAIYHPSPTSRFRCRVRPLSPRVASSRCLPLASSSRLDFLFGSHAICNKGAS